MPPELLPVLIISTVIIVYSLYTFPVGYLTFIEVLLYMFHLWGQALAYSLYWHCYCLNGERGGELMIMYTFRSVYSVVWTYRAKSLYSIAYTSVSQRDHFKCYNDQNSTDI